VTLLAPAIRSNLVLGPVAAAADEPVLAATANRAMLDLLLFVHKEIFLRPLF
jgi:hypothetical protein